MSAILACRAASAFCWAIKSARICMSWLAWLLASWFAVKQEQLASSVHPGLRASGFAPQFLPSMLPRTAAL
jgi:hypothetical protein